MSEEPVVYQVSEGGSSIIRDRGEASHFTMIPNMIDDDERLTPESIRLYLHYRRRAGENGGCFEGQRATAEHCHMSSKTIVAAKRLLQQCGYIKIDRIKRKDNRWTDQITVTNIWELNALRFQKKPQEADRFPSKGYAVSKEIGSGFPPDTVKNNPSNNPISIYALCATKLFEELNKDAYTPFQRASNLVTVIYTRLGKDTEPSNEEARRMTSMVKRHGLARVCLALPDIEKYQPLEPLDYLERVLQKSTGSVQVAESTLPNLADHEAQLQREAAAYREAAAARRTSGGIGDSQHPSGRRSDG